MAAVPLQLTMNARDDAFPVPACGHGMLWLLFPQVVSATIESDYRDGKLIPGFGYLEKRYQE